MDPVVVVETPAVWRGTEATLQSESFVGADTLPVVRLNGTPASVRYLDSTRLAVRMPDSVGHYAVTVTLHDGGIGIADSIATGGSLDRVLAGPSISGPFQFPARHGGQIVANVWSTTPITVAVIDLANPSVVSGLLPDSLSRPSCLNGGPGQSVSGGFVVAGGPPAVPYSCDMLRVWSYAPNGALTAIDSLYASGAVNAYLGNHAWLQWFNHAYYRTISYPGRYEVVRLQAVEGNVAILSPRGDRAVPISGGVDPALGVPVFATDTAFVAYRLPGGHFAGADFSANGDTLFIGIGPRTSTSSIAISAVDATSGTIFGRSDSLAADNNGAVVADPAEPWLYFQGLESGDRPVVNVLDRRTMRLVTTLRIPDAQWTPVNRGWYYMFLDAIARRLYLYETTNGRIYEFSVLP